MLDAAEEAIAHVRQRGRADLGGDTLAMHGLVRLIEIIGEAAANVSPARRGAMPAVPWREIVTMRNRVVHGYYDINVDLVWDTITDDLPPLINELRRHLSPPA